MSEKSELREFYNKLDSLYSRGDQGEIEGFLTASANSYRPCCGAFREEYVAVLNEQGSFYRGVSRYAASANAFETAKELVGSHLGRHNPAYATIINNLAGTRRLAGEYDTALLLFEEALDIYRQNGLEQSYPCASALNNMALVCQQLGDYPRGIDCCRRAAALLEEQEQYCAEQAITHANLALLLGLVGESAEAEQSLNQALALFESTPDEPNPHYAAALNTLAGSCYQCGDYPRAAEMYTRVLELTYRFFGKNVEYAIACESLAACLERMGQPRQALERQRQAADLFGRIHGSESDRWSAAQSACDRLLSLVGEGSTP